MRVTSIRPHEASRHRASAVRCATMLVALVVALPQARAQRLVADTVRATFAPADTTTLAVTSSQAGGDTAFTIVRTSEPAFALGDTAAARRLRARALGLAVLHDPRLAAPGRPSLTERDAIARDLGASSWRWCGAGGRGKRIAQWSVGATFVGGNLALYEYFRRAWWSNEEKPFWIHWDWGGSFRDQDKLGHFLGGYVLAEAGRELLEMSCMSEKKAALWGAAYSAAFQLQIEIWDGTQRMFGFSPPDLLYNSIGQGMSLLHTFVPKTRAVLPTFSYSPTVAMRRTSAGEITSELRTTVDYSGQTYWLSFDIDTLLPRRAARWWPGLLRLSAGHTITDWVSPETGLQVQAQRRWMLSLDLDPLRLPGKAPWWMATKKILRHYRFPAPALEITSDGIRGIPWHR